MPTQPPPTLFDADLAKAQVRPLIDVAAPVLKEVLHHGLALFARCSYRPEGHDENLAILLTYRHLLEMLDAVAILIAESAPGPAALQLRSMFESLLTIEYITQDREKTRARALAYLYGVELQRKHFYLSQDPNTSEGQALRESISDDPYSRDWKPAGGPGLAECLRKIETLLNTVLKETGEEYRRTRKALNRRPYWYSLYGGPKSIRELAQLLKRAAAYEFLYREWSERSHSVDSVDRILTHNSAGPAARSLRDATELNSTIDFAIAFAMDAARSLIRYYRPAEELAFSKWYRDEISTNWKKIPKIEVRSAD